MDRKTALAIVALAATAAPAIADDSVLGTWSLVSTERKYLDTGQTLPVLPQQGYINYSPDGRMLVVIVQPNRPKPKTIEGMSDKERIDLFGTVVAYGGTYKFDGKEMKHNIDISWNEVWTNTTQVRDVKRDGDRLIYNTRPAPNAVDGRMSTTTLIWQKVK